MGPAFLAARSHLQEKQNRIKRNKKHLPSVDIYHHQLQKKYIYLIILVRGKLVLLFHRAILREELFMPRVVHHEPQKQPTCLQDNVTSRICSWIALEPFTWLLPLPLSIYKRQQWRINQLVVATSSSSGGEGKLP